jgi:DNA (cytosine-5)-methyltransferase 1
MTAATATKTFCEFFAGIGLVHAGLLQSGWQCVFANDIDIKKKQMFEGHFGPTDHYHVHDIWETGRSLREIPKKPFLATASFPCVDLSLAGHWKGFEGERSSTYFGFIEVLRALGPRRPEMVMLENVYGFLTSDGGRDFEKAIGELAALGYWVDAIVLDAKWFVPQSRPRVFVFGFHESIRHCILPQTRNGYSQDPEWVSAVEATRMLRPAPIRRAFETVELSTGWATVEFRPPVPDSVDLAAVLDTDDGQDWWDEKAVLKHYDLMEAPSRSRVDALLQSGECAIGTAFRRTRRAKARTEVRFDIAGCLRTPKGGSAKQLVIAISGGKLRMRWMSAREYARLQGAGDFKITVPAGQAMHGFGDAVCVPAISWIDRQILTPVFNAAIASTPTAVERYGNSSAVT